MKKAIVTGVCGQDGFYMAQLLAKKGYEVIGIAHRHNDKDSVVNLTEVRELDMSDCEKVYDLVREIHPDELYNFAAQSSSIDSWDMTIETCGVNFMAVAAILKSICDNAPDCRLFQASSAEVFGRDPDLIPQNEDTLKNPCTPYATTKTAAGMLIANYRDYYNVFAINGIFYNHESIRRKDTFLSTKITRTVAGIKKGTAECLYIGNIDSKRDWGYAPDYMYAAWKAMQLSKSDDYIFATGVLHSVREMIERAFEAASLSLFWEGKGENEVGILKDTGKIVVRIDTRFYRSYDRNDSVGDPTKLFQAIGWRPCTSFESMINNMTRFFLDSE